MILPYELWSLVFRYLSREDLVALETFIPTIIRKYWLRQAQPLMESDPYFIGLSEDTVIRFLSRARVVFTSETNRSPSIEKLLVYPDIPKIVFGFCEGGFVCIQTLTRALIEFKEPIENVRTFDTFYGGVLAHRFDNSVQITFYTRNDEKRVIPNITLMRRCFGLRFDGTIINMLTNYTVTAPPNTIDFDIFVNPLDEGLDEMNNVFLDDTGQAYIRLNDMTFELIMSGVKQVLCSEHHVFLLTHQGELYSMGAGYHTLLLSIDVLTMMRNGGGTEYGDEMMRIMALRAHDTCLFHIPISEDKVLFPNDITKVCNYIYTSTVPRLTSYMINAQGRCSIEYD